jgi:streptogramin lyase
MKGSFLVTLLLSLFSAYPLRADIPGYEVSTPVLDIEIHPRLVSAAPNGNVWFFQQTTIPYSIGFFTPSGHVTNFPVPCTQCLSGEEIVYVWGLASDPDSSVWFIDNHAKSDGTSIQSRIGHLTTSGEFTFFPIPTRHGTALVPNGFGHSSLTLASDGSVWFTENAGFRAGLLTPSTGSFIEYPLEAPELPSGITIGADGKVWFAVTSSHEIAQITPPSTGAFVEFPVAFGAYPLGIATGADGNIWFTEAGRHRIARLRPTGTITEFQLPTSNGVPQHIVAAPDGTLWYTESAGMDIGRITLNGPSDPTFEALATPDRQNFDLTVAPSPRGGVIVYFTSRNIATGQDQLSVVAPLCAAGPVIHGPFLLSSTGHFRGAFTIEGRDPLNITLQDLPQSWSAQLGRVTIIDSDPNPQPGIYTFTISVVDADGCSRSEQITVRIVGPRRRVVGR